MSIVQHDPYAALRYKDFWYYVSAHFVFTLALLMQEVVLAYYLYDITGDPLALGLIGLAEAVPFILLALPGGHLADKYSRRKVYLGSFSFVCLVSVLLEIFLNPDFTDPKTPDLQAIVIYAAVFMFGIARGFYNPSWNSLKPFLVKPEHYANSASWSAQFWQVGRIIGPVAGGFSYAFLGLHISLVIISSFMFITWLLAWQIAEKPVKNQITGKMRDGLFDGYRFLRKNKILWYAIVLDMFSVLFGGVIAILPVFAKDILHTDATGLGVLRAAPAAGAVLVMLGTAYFPPTNRAWRNMLIAVAGFGVATLVFAVSTNFVLSCVALFFTGGFDSISVVVRSTILQLLPPDNMRGRIQAVNGLFVSTSNELGAFESGVAAKLLGTVPSVLFGGVMTLCTVTYIYFKSRDLLGVKLNEVEVKE